MNTQNEIAVFSSPEFGEVRTMNQNGEPLFCLADVCRILEIRNPSQIKTRLTPSLTNNEVGVKTPQGVITVDLETVTGKKKDGTAAVQIVPTTFINEPNLYRCIFQSRKAEAEKFQDWIFTEVLPAIRKTGGYMMAAGEESEEDIMARALKIAEATIDRQKQRLQMMEGENAENRRVIGILEPKAQYTDDVLQSTTTYTFTQMAKELDFSSVYKFIDFLKANGVVYRQSGQYLITARFGGKGFTTTRTARFFRADGTPDSSVSTVWTERGRWFLHNLKERVSGKRPEQVKDNNNNNSVTKIGD